MSAYKQEISKDTLAQIIPSKTAEEAVKGVELILMATSREN